MWVRGLKHLSDDELFEVCSVAPRVGAWIETNNSDYKSQIEASHPVWVRGLKQSLGNTKGKLAGSHPVWVRGLKQQPKTKAQK